MTICTKVFAAKPSVVGLVAFCATALVTSGDNAWAEEILLRVAVIDTDDKPSVPPALLELIVVHLSQEKELAVLERQGIDAVLREQGRNLTLANDAAQNDLVAAHNAGIDNLLAAHQPFGYVHGNGANRAFAQMLRNLQHQPFAIIICFQRVQNGR